MLRAAACVGLSLWLARLLGFSNGYWAPMTAMIVLKPGLSETGTRGLARLGGTIAGGATATLATPCATGYAWFWLLPAVAVAATAAFAMQKAHYAILTSAVTATVVLLLTLAEGGNALQNAEHRLIATLIGGYHGAGGGALSPCTSPAAASLTRSARRQERNAQAQNATLNPACTDCRFQSPAMLAWYLTKPAKRPCLAVRLAPTMALERERPGPELMKGVPSAAMSAWPGPPAAAS